MQSREVYRIEVNSPMPDTHIQDVVALHDRTIQVYGIHEHEAFPGQLIVDSNSPKLEKVLSEAFYAAGKGDEWTVSALNTDHSDHVVGEGAPSHVEYLDGGRWVHEDDIV
jgi:hypothetical protein